MKKTIVTLMALMLAVGFAAAQVDSSTVDGGDVESNNLQDTQETNKWAMIYGSVDTTVNLEDPDAGAEGETVFTWDEYTPDGSAVLAANQDEEFGGDASDLAIVNDQEDLDGVPTEGQDSFDNTYDASAALNVIDETETQAADSDSSSTGENLFAYVNSEATNNEPVWAGEVAEGEAHQEDDYEVLVGQEEELSEGIYDLYIELQ